MSGNFNLADYATVDERIDKYWQSHPKPEGSIQTEIIWVSQDGNSVAIKATVYQGDRILATGIAQEERLTGLDKWGKPAKGANTSSWWENCETSAIGRALANMGMSLSKRASREEMQKVQRYADRREDMDEADEDAHAQPAAPPDDLAIMRSMAAKPEARKAALHRYYSAADSPADLNVRADAAYETGIDADVLKAAFRHHHDRLSKQFAPAGIAD
jgi:hypothetical protein